MKEQKEPYTKPELVAHAPLRDLTATASSHRNAFDDRAEDNANCHAAFKSCP